MLVIWMEGTVSVRDMGRRLYLDSGTLTPVLKNLEAKGLIHRRRSQLDERVLLVTATEAGLALKEKAAAISTFEMESSGLTADEAATLRTLLYKLLTHKA
jgi:DNA-binding MarR family transcriptional regulator